MTHKIVLFITVVALISACATPQSGRPEGIAQQSASTVTPTSKTSAAGLPPAWTPTQTLVPSDTPTITLSPTTTLTPTNVNTRTPLPTRTEHPQRAALAAVKLTLNDLPQGYDELPISPSDLQSMPLQEDGLIPLSASAFINEDTQGAALSVVSLFEDPQSQDDFDRSIDNVDEEMANLESEFGLSAFGMEIEMEVIPDFPPIGDKSVAIRAVMQIESEQAWFEIAMFRRDTICVSVMITVLPTIDQNPDLATLTQRLDNRVRAALES